MKPDQPSDPERRHLDLGGRPVACTDEGAGSPVVAIHGLPGSVRDWRWLGGALAGRVRLVRMDLPGFGDTSAEVAPPEVDAQATLVLDLIEHLGLVRPLLLSHSFGGSIAVAAAARGDVAGLALLASIGLTPHHSYRMVPVPRLLAAATRAPGLRSVLNPLLRRAMIQGGFPRSVTVSDAVRSVQMVGGFDFAAHRANIAALTCPTLVGWTQDDPLVEHAISEALAAACPPGPRLCFETGGHNLQKTHAVEIADAVLKLAIGPGDPVSAWG